MNTVTKENILNNLENPAELEKLYRENKALFKKEFQSLNAPLDNMLAAFWNERLNYNTATDWGNRKQWIKIIILSVVAAFIAKIPHLFLLDNDFFYTRNIGFIIFPPLMAYFFIKEKTSIKAVVITLLALIVSAIFINWLPTTNNSDTVILSCIHLPLILWFFLGYSFTEGNLNSYEKRLAFLRYNGDLLVISALILIAGLIMSAITINLFSLIGFKIEEFYAENIVVIGLAATPVIGTFIIQTNPQLVSKISPVIARLFSPLVLVVLLSYLIAIIVSGKDPYNDREFLLIFNLLLLGVMALILFSVAETSGPSNNKVQTLLLLLLSILTIIVNGIALSAIIFRIAEWGFTPNRLAVLGSNMLILIHLLFVAFQLLKTFRNKSSIGEVGKVIATFLPMYFFWAVIVTFLMPFFFNFK